MQKITLDKTGIYFDFWDESSEDWITKDILEGSMPITWYLDYPIQLTERISVRDLIWLLAPHIDHIDLVMAHDLSGIEINDVIQLLDKSDHVAKKIEPTCVYLIRVADAIPTKNGDEELNFLNTYPLLVGLEEIDETGDNDEVISLSGIDFLDWCDLPIEFDDYLEYVNPETEEVLFEGIMNWKLRDLISTVLSQISTTLLVTQAISLINSKARVESGPIPIQAVFEWIDDLDKILIK